MTTGERIATEARTWVGTPFRHAGRKKIGEPGAGVDCIGLLIGVVKVLGLSDYDKDVYSRLIHPEELRAELDAFFKLADGPEAAGDIGLISIGGAVQHICIFTGTGTAIHAWEEVGGVVETTVTRVWSRLIKERLRWRDA